MLATVHPATGGAPEYGGLRESAFPLPLAGWPENGLDSASPCWSAAVDIIFLHDLRIETTIGIYEWERRIRQTVTLDIEVATDAARASASDRIEDALDYKAIAKRVIEFVSSSEFQLVETLADRAAALVREEFAVPWVRLRLNKKYAIRGATDVGIVVERGERTT